MKLDSTGSRQWTYQTGSTAQDTAEVPGIISVFEPPRHRVFSVAVG